MKTGLSRDLFSFLLQKGKIAYATTHTRLKEKEHEKKMKTFRIVNHYTQLIISSEYIINYFPEKSIK